MRRDDRSAVSPQGWQYMISHIVYLDRSRSWTLGRRHPRLTPESRHRGAAKFDQEWSTMTGPRSRLGTTTLTRRRLLALSVAAAAAAACRTPQGQESSASLLRYGEAGAFTTLNPWSQAVHADSVGAQVFSRLVYKTADGQPVGDLAESWRIADDGLSIRLELRPGVQWHDGAELVADNFVEMYDYLSDPALQSDQGVQKMKEFFAPVKAVRAPDQATVDMEFSTPVPYILDLLNYWYALRLDDPDDTDFVRHLPTGTGPFRMTDFAPSQGASFEAFDDYHVQNQPNASGFRFDIYAEGSNLVPNLTSGQVHGVLVSNYAELESLQGDSAYYLDPSRIGVWPLQVNVSKPPFDQAAVRQALSYSMNRQAFAEAASFGLEEPVTSPFYTEGATGYVPELVAAHPFDLDMARSLLSSAGVDSLTVTYPAPASFPFLGALGEIWQQDLAEIGVTLDVQTVSQGRWYELGAGEDPEADVVPWQVGRSLLDGAVFFAANGGYLPGSDHRFGYRNAALENLIGRGRTEPDPDRRKQMYREINRIMIDECANISMCTYSETFAWSSAVTGAGYGVSGNLMLAEAAVET